jgi:hypothetical protein
MCERNPLIRVEEIQRRLVAAQVALEIDDSLSEEAREYGRRLCAQLRIELLRANAHARRKPRT